MTKPDTTGRAGGISTAPLPETIESLRRQRDDAYAALRAIAEGNLGDMPWQANYQTIKLVASVAIPAEHRTSPTHPQEQDDV